MYERPRVNVKVERGSTLTFTRDLSLFYLRVLSLRAYARKNYATLEIHLEGYSRAKAEPMSNLKSMGEEGGQ